MEGIDYIATYLADELLSTNLHDLDVVKSKIKASLSILSERSISKKEIHQLSVKAKRHLYVIDKHKHDLKYWKDKLRENCSQEQMEFYYNDIDNVRLKNGFT